MNYKTCSKCSATRSTADFHRDKAGKFGVRASCKECDLARKKAAYANDPEKYLERRRQWGEANAEYCIEYNRERHKRYYPRNKNKYRARARRSGPTYRAKRAKRIPPWLTEEHKFQINQFYEHAKDCEIVSGERYHVDHIVPLMGKDICGLHVPWNLQVLPADINQRKSNKYVPSEEPCED